MFVVYELYHTLSCVHFVTSRLLLQEKKREEEESEAQLSMMLAQEATYAKMAREISNEVCSSFPSGLGLLFLIL